MEDSLEISASMFFGMNDLPDLLHDENNPKVSCEEYMVYHNHYLISEV